MKPLVSVCLLCYNQKDYIIDALKALVGQTYENMEIVISDDVSTDGSSELIQSFIKEYEKSHLDGRKKIIYNRNTTNLGNLKNSEKCYSLASGELLVKADGDDISMPDRVEKIVKTWAVDFKTVKALYSDAISISLTGRDLGVRHNNNKLLGAVAAYSPECYSRFNGIEYPDAHEDVIYYYRACMLGVARWITEPLVRYRIGCGASSNRGAYRALMTKCFKRGVLSFKQLLLDCEYLRQKGVVFDYDRFRNIYENALKTEMANVDLWDGETFKIRYQGCKNINPSGWYTVAGLIHTILLLPRCIATPILELMYRVRVAFNHGEKMADWRY